MMFPDEMHEDADFMQQDEEEDKMIPGKRQFNDDDEDEGDLQAEEADQVFDDFGGPSGSISQGAVVMT